MVATHYRWDFIGLSTDTKPTPETSEKVVDGSTFYCSDNSKLYVWCKNQWYEKEVSGGGGTTYTAGTGIDITANTISVDTATIQPKLTAGTGIDITDNTISATGGSGPTVVQTTGNSTTDVMSQKGVTDTLFKNNDTAKTQIGYNADASGGTYYPAVAIGQTAKATGGSSTAIGAVGCTASGNSSVAIGRAEAINQGAVGIGYASSARGTGSVAIGGANGSTDSASAQYNGSIALGMGASASAVGEMNIGDRTSTYGYNSSAYRLLTGLYDGQSAHDAVTIGQINNLIDAINTATGSNISHIGA